MQLLVLVTTTCVLADARLCLPRLRGYHTFSNSMVQTGTDSKSRQPSRKSQRAEKVSNGGTDSQRAGVSKGSCKSPDKSSSSKLPNKPSRRSRHPEEAIQDAPGSRLRSRERPAAGGRKPSEKPAAADKKAKRGSRRAQAAAEDAIDGQDSGTPFGPWSHADQSGEGTFTVRNPVAAEGETDLGEADLAQISETLQSLRMPSRTSRRSSMDSASELGLRRGSISTK